MADAYEINVKNPPYSAVGDGVTDDSAAFQAALDDANAATVNGSVFGGVTSPIGLGSGPVVVIPYGQYKIGSALTVHAYARIVGQDAVLIGGSAAGDILSMQAQEQSIHGLALVGGRYQMNVTTSVGSLYVTECKFVRPGSAGFRSATGTNVGYFRLGRCQFLGQSRLTVTGATNASPIVVTTSSIHGLVTGQSVNVAGVLGNTSANGTHTVTVLTSTTFSLVGTTGSGTYTSGGVIVDDSHMMDCSAGDEVALDQCLVVSCQAQPFVMATGSMVVRDLFATPSETPFGLTWFTLTNAQLRVSNSHFGGEYGATLAEWNVIDDAGNDVFALAPFGDLCWTNNVALAGASVPAFKFNGLPQRFKYGGNLGGVGALYFSAAISPYARSLVGQGCSFEFDQIPLEQQVLAFLAGLGSSAAVASDVVGLSSSVESLVRVPEVSDVVGIIGQYGYGIYIAGADGSSSNLSSSVVAGSWNGSVNRGTATADGAVFSQTFHGGLLNTARAAGVYTAVFNVNVDSDCVVTAQCSVGFATTRRSLARGRHAISVPFSLERVPTFWTASTAYALYDVVYVAGGAYSPGAIGFAYLCIQAGTSGSTAPSGTGGPGSPFSDGGCEWVYWPVLDLSLRISDVPDDSTFSVGDIRLLKGRWQIRDVNTIATGTAAPTRGYWQKGDKILNQGVAASGTYAWVCVSRGPSAAAWQASTVYAAGDFVTANGNVYICAVGGTSASSGSGPSGYVFPAQSSAVTPTISDGTVSWMWGTGDVAAVWKTLPINS